MSKQEKTNAKKGKPEVWNEIVNGMRRVKSCGVLLFNKDKTKFLLMKHANRYDLPKGHREVGETDEQTAIRELREETGIQSDDFNLIDNFVFEETYYPTYKRFGGEKVEKKLVMFLGVLKDDKEIKLTEHKGFEWIEWKPPHNVQKNTIDPLLQKVEKHFQSMK